MKEKVLKFITDNKNILLIATLVIAIGFVVYLLIPNKTSEVTIESNPEYYEDYSKADGSIKGKTLEELGLLAEINYIVAEPAKVRRTQNFAQNNTIYELKFGTTIYTKVIDSTSLIKVDKLILERENKKGFIAVYADKPTRITDMPVGYISEEEFVAKKAFKNYKPEITVEEIVKIDIKFLDVIEANSTFDGIPYFLSDNAERVKNTLLFGDFNNDGIQDMAAIIDDIDVKKSGILIFFKKDGVFKLAFKRSFLGVMKGKTVKKETPIILKSDSTIFPLDGIYITGKENNYFLVFDSESNDFMTITKDVPVVIPAPKSSNNSTDKGPQKITYKSSEKSSEKISEKTVTKPSEKAPIKK